MSEKRQNEAGFLMQGSILAIASIISRVVGLLYRVPLKSIIGKTGNDYYGTAFEIYSIILIISSYSIPLAVSKLVATRMHKGQAKNAYRVLKGALIFASVTGGTAAILVFFFAKQLTDLLKTPMSMIALQVLAPVIFIVAVVGVFRGFFQGLHTTVPSAISQIFEQVVNAIVSVVAAYYLFSYGKKVGSVLGNPDAFASAYGAAGGTLGTAMGAVTALICVLFIFGVYRGILKKKIKKDKTLVLEGYREIFKLLIITIIPVLLSTTLYNVSSIIDTGIFKSIAHAQKYDPNTISEWWGVYTGQYRVLINVPISIASALAASSVPALAAAFHSGEDMRLKRQVHMATRFIMVVSFPCAVGLFVLSGPIMQLLFFDPDKTSAYMLMVGAVSVLFYSLSTLSNGILQGIDKMRIPVRNAAIALVLQAGLLVILMYTLKLNIYAVILANAFYALLMCILNGLSVKKYTGTVQDIKTTYVIPGISALIMGVAVYVVYQLLMLLLSSNIIATIVSIIVGAIIYFVVILLFGGINEIELLRFPKGELLVKIAKKLRLL